MTDSPSEASSRLPWLTMTLLLVALSLSLMVVALLLRSRPERPESYPLVGVVRSVDRTTGVVSIRHEEIPGFMPAMTMPFDLKGQAVLDEIQPGDRIRGVLEVRPESSALIDVVIEARALAPPEPAADEPPSRMLAVGARVPDFQVTTQEGKPLKLSDLRGEVVVLTFIYTRCPIPDFCPLMDQKFQKLAAMIEPHPAWARGVRLLSVSFDPEHDTPDVLSRHAQLRGAKPPLWTFAVASHDELRKVAQPLGLMYGPTPNEIIHNLTTAVIAPDGTLARLEAGNKWTPEVVFKTVVGLLRPTEAPNPKEGGRGT